MKFHLLALALISPLAFSQVAFGQTCDMSIDANDQMQFSKQELKVDAGCTEVNLTLKHTGQLKREIMGHNWVLFETPNKEFVIQDSVKAGLSKDYVSGDKKVLAKTKLIGGGEQSSVKFSTKALKKGGDYTFACTFPGHAALMVGKLIFK